MKSLSVRELLDAYNKGERRFENIDVDEYQSMDGNMLCDAVFVNCFLSCIDFSNSNLSNVTFKGCNLKCSQFDNAVLTNSTIENCLMEASSFKNAWISGMVFKENYHYGATINQDDFLENF